MGSLVSFVYLFILSPGAVEGRTVGLVSRREEFDWIQSCWIKTIENVA
jgi:hypothetical protein